MAHSRLLSVVLAAQTMRGSAQMARVLVRAELMKTGEGGGGS